MNINIEERKTAHKTYRIVHFNFINSNDQLDNLKLPSAVNVQSLLWTEEDRQSNYTMAKTNKTNLADFSVN